MTREKLRRLASKFHETPGCTTYLFQAIRSRRNWNWTSVTSNSFMFSNLGTKEMIFTYETIGALSTRGIGRMVLWNSTALWQIKFVILKRIWLQYWTQSMYLENWHWWQDKCSYLYKNSNFFSSKSVVRARVLPLKLIEAMNHRWVMNYSPNVGDSLMVVEVWGIAVMHPKKIGQKF